MTWPPDSGHAPTPGLKAGRGARTRCRGRAQPVQAPRMALRPGLENWPRKPTRHEPYEASAVNVVANMERTRENETGNWEVCDTRPSARPAGPLRAPQHLWRTTSITTNWHLSHPKTEGEAVPTGTKTTRAWLNRRSGACQTHPPDRGPQPPSIRTSPCGLPEGSAPTRLLWRPSNPSA